MNTMVHVKQAGQRSVRKSRHYRRLLCVQGVSVHKPYTDTPGMWRNMERGGYRIGNDQISRDVNHDGMISVSQDGHPVIGKTITTNK